MRRFAAKSGGKSRIDVTAPVTAAPPAPSDQPAETVDVVPGRLTQSTWMSLIRQEEGEEVVANIVAELMEGVMDRCYEVYLKRQLIPISVWWAVNSLVETVECLLLSRDEQDGLGPECGLWWQEDPEPEPCAVESWAEGSVPVLLNNTAV